MAALNRLYSWVALTALSVVILSALVDQLPPSTRNGKEKYVITTASISLIFGSLFTVGNIVDSLRNLIIGNAVENGKTRRSSKNNYFVPVSFMVYSILYIASHLQYLTDHLFPNPQESHPLSWPCG